MKRLKVGIVGCGAIAKNAYLPSFFGHYAPFVEVVACADAVPAAAEACAAAFSIPRVVAADKLVGDPEVELVVNLTVPEAHYALNRQALLAGRHVYCEKPLALSAAEAVELGRLAEERGLMLAVAPDTLLGAPHQAARKALDAGVIGTVRHASAWCSLNIGIERYYRPAAGPALDFGPYYIGLLVMLLGPVSRVASLGAPVALPRPGVEGETFLPESPGHLGVALQFASGATGTLGLATDACIYESGVELIGTRGRLSVPDPNKFEGSARLKTHEVDEALPAGSALNDRHRGAGVADMACALREGRTHRLGNAFSVHCTEVLVSMAASLRSGQVFDVTTRCTRPVVMPGDGAVHPFAATT